ncbi:MAG: hypothetical protein ABIP33_06470 [Pseudolysinimonas sp.]
MTNNLDPNQIRVAGNGGVWKAPVGTVFPVDSVSAYGAGFAHLGYFTDGFTVTQDLKTQDITAWQTLDVVRRILTSLTRRISWEALESDKQNLSMAFGGATTVQTGVAVGGAVTFTAGTITTATAHGRAIGDAVYFTVVAGSPGVIAGQTYFVTSIPTSTTLTVSANLNSGANVTITVGTATGLVPASAFTLSVPDSAIAQEFCLGVDVVDGPYSYRFVIPRATFNTLPTIKYTRTDAIRLPADIQLLKPLDGSASLQPIGFDWAAAS